MSNVPYALTPEGIRAVRKQLGMSQHEFADHIYHVGKRGNRPHAFTISRWETGRQSPDRLYAPILLTIAKKAKGGEDDHGEPEPQPVAADGGV